MHDEPVAELVAQLLAELLQRVDRRGLVVASSSSRRRPRRRVLVGGLVGARRRAVRLGAPPGLLAGPPRRASVLLGWASSTAASSTGSSPTASCLDELLGLTSGASASGLGSGSRPRRSTCSVSVSYCSDTCCSVASLVMSCGLSRCGRAAAAQLVSPAKTANTSLPKPRSSSRDERHHHEHEHHDHDEVGDQLLLRRPDDLAELGDDLAVEGGGAGALVGHRSRAAPRTALAVRHGCSPLSSVADWSTVCPAGLSSQGTRDLNPQPSVLETDALPVELVPSGDSRPAARCPAERRAARSMWENHQTRSLRGRAGAVQTATPTPRALPASTMGP